MQMGSLLLSLMPVAAIAFIVFHYRTKSRRRRQEREARERALLQDIGMPVARSAIPATPVMSPGVLQSPVRDVAPAPVQQVAINAPVLRLRDTVLDQPLSLVYLLLKTSLPEYHVMARVPLTGVITSDDPGPWLQRENMVLDFVVCNGSLAPMVVVTLAEPGESHQADDPLDRIGLRHVKFSPRELPRRDKVRALLGFPDTTMRGV